jgi:hypothetical protein
MRKLDNIKYFVFCSGKTGSTTIVNGLNKKFGHNSVLHVHGTAHFEGAHKNKGSLKDLIIRNSEKFDKIYIIDSYREPFERGIASFFQNINKHCPNWRSMDIDSLINFFNEKKFYLLDLYHSYHESWGFFDVSTDIEFDFEKGYITKEHENIVFVKTRLKEVYRWDKIFSEIFNTDISFKYENDSKDKEYHEVYTEFKEKYKLPTEVRNNFLSVINGDINNSDKSRLFYLSWSEMKKFMTETEINHYLEKWKIKNQI